MNFDKKIQAEIKANFIKNTDNEEIIVHVIIIFTAKKFSIKVPSLSKSNKILLYPLYQICFSCKLLLLQILYFYYHLNEKTPKMKNKSGDKHVTENKNLKSFENKINVTNISNWHF